MPAFKKGYKQVKTGDRIRLGDLWKWRDKYVYFDNDTWYEVDRIALKEGGSVVCPDEIVIRKTKK